MSLEKLAEVMKYHTEETFDESEHKRNTSGEFSKKRGSVRGSRKPSRARGGKKSLNKLDGKVNRFGRKVSISGSSREESLEETHKKVLAVDPEKFKDALLDYDPDNDEQRAKMDSVFLFPDGDLKIGTDGDIDHDLTMGTTFDGIMGAKLMDELESGATNDDNIFTKYCNKYDIVRITSFGNSIGLEGNKMTEDQRQSLSRMMRSGKYQSISFEGNTKDGISDLVIDRWTNKALTDVNKLEISDHWDYINQIGREWYLKRTRQDENNSVRAWDEMNHDVKSKIGRMMNEARHKKTSGRYTQGYVDNDVNIGLNRYGTMIEGILRNLTPEDRESIADLRRHVVAKLQEIYPKDDYLGFDERIARKTVDKIMGVNIKKGTGPNDGRGLFVALVGKPKKSIDTKDSVKSLDRLQTIMKYHTEQTFKEPDHKRDSDGKFDDKSGKSALGNLQSNVKPKSKESSSPIVRYREGKVLSEMKEGNIDDYGDVSVEDYHKFGYDARRDKYKIPQEGADTSEWIDYWEERWSSTNVAFRAVDDDVLGHILKSGKWNRPDTKFSTPRGKSEVVNADDPYVSVSGLETEAMPYGRWVIMIPKDKINLKSPLSRTHKQRLGSSGSNRGYDLDSPEMIEHCSGNVEALVHRDDPIPPEAVIKFTRFFSDEKVPTKIMERIKKSGLFKDIVIQDRALKRESYGGGNREFELAKGVNDKLDILIKRYEERYGSRRISSYGEFAVSSLNMMDVWGDERGRLFTAFEGWIEENTVNPEKHIDLKDKAQLGTFGTILAGVLIGLGGYATVKTIKGVMSKQGYDPSFLTTAIGSVVGSGLLVGGTKKIFNLRKGITFITVKKEIEHMSSMIPTYASDEGFHGGHEVITTDGEQGVIISLKGQYVDIRQKSGKISHVHVNNLIKADEVIVTKDGATRWGLMDYGQRRDLLKAKNLPETLSYKHWSQLDKNLHNIILKTSHDEDEDEAELSLEEKAVCPHCGKSDCECSTNKGDQIKTKPETPEKITESAEKGGYDKRTKLFKTGGKSVPELVKAILQSKKKA